MNANKIRSLTRKVTKKWAKQRVKEIKDKRARGRRLEVFVRSPKPMSIVDAAERAIPMAYQEASSNGSRVAKQRQIYYKARPIIQELIGKEMDQKQSRYFTGTVLPNYLTRHPETERWRVASDARGTVTEPHTGKSVPVGTTEIEAYLGAMTLGDVRSMPTICTFKLDYPTCGTRNRCGAVFFTEKEGFNQLFAQVGLAERYDLLMLSSKGQSVKAARRLVDALCDISSKLGVPLLTLHDFDRAGMLITENLTRVSEAAREQDRVRYEFRNKIDWHDIGLRLDDVNRLDLISEPCPRGDKFRSDTIATAEEQKFLLSGRRVELNAFSSADLVTFIEEKLDELGIGKVIPESKVLEGAYRRAWQINYVNEQIGTIFADAKKMANVVCKYYPSGDDLADMVRQIIVDENRAMSWDDAIAKIVCDNHDGSTTYSTIEVSGMAEMYKSLADWLASVDHLPCFPLDRY